jgi:hypothetical protein
VCADGQLLYAEQEQRSPVEARLRGSKHPAALPPMW